MSSVIIAGNSSGSITVAAPAVAGTNTITMPASTGTMALTSDVPDNVLNTYATFVNSTVQVDGSSITPEWQGGAAPTEGNINSIDSYTYTIIKTGDAAFTILAALTQFA